MSKFAKCPENGQHSSTLEIALCGQKSKSFVTDITCQMAQNSQNWSPHGLNLK